MNNFNYVRIFIIPDLFNYNHIPIILKQFILFLLLLWCCKITLAQRYSNVHYYSITDGLPSNRVYKCLQDKKGFLWLATENGLSRFDGHSFKNFSVKDGLPDNDIIDIFLDSAGNIWIIPFARFPVYFDNKTNQIITEKSLPELTKIKGKNHFLGHAIPNGDVVFYNNNFNGYLFRMKEKRVTKLSLHNPYYITRQDNEQFEITGKAIIYSKNGTVIRSIESPMGELSYVSVGEEQNKLLFIKADSSIIQLKGLDNRLAPEILVNKFHFRVWTASFLKNYIGIASRNGLIYLADKNTLSLKDSIKTGAIVKSICEDKDGNFWIATEDKGIIRIGNPSIVEKIFQNETYQDVLSLLVDSAELISGNVSGSILQRNGGSFNIRRVKPVKGFYNNFFIRKILKRKGDVYLIASQGLFLKKSDSFEQLGVYKGFKDAFQYDDTIMLLGTHDRLCSFNFKTGHFKDLATQRISALTADEEHNVYIGSNDGLYKWKDNRLESLAENNGLFSYSVTKLYATRDNLVWVALSNDTLLAMRHDTIILKLSLSNISEGTVCKSLKSNTPGVIWVGSDKSLVKINYQINNGKISISCIPYTKTDGLTEGHVNDICFFNDSVYVATTFGICKFQCNTRPVIKDIPVYITQISVNQNDIAVQDSLLLNPTENNLLIKFSAVDLSGFFPTIQFRINDGNWQNISDNVLMLSGLKSGMYNISIRALKKNFEPSSRIAHLTINIKTPLFQKPITLVIIMLLLLGIALYLFNSWKLSQEKRKQFAQQALDKQRQQFTADLHDDIGASLSSLQINSAIAAQVLDKNPDKSKEMLVKVENQSQQLAEKIGDFIWSMKPGNDEFMTLTNRVKNYIADILGNGIIDYSITIDDSIDSVISDFMRRKNILLIIKEALNNAVKYSNAKHISVQLQLANGVLIISVADDGVGIDTFKKQGNGLLNMQERVKEMGGTFEIKTAPGYGTSIKAVIPVP